MRLVPGCCPVCPHFLFSLKLCSYNTPSKHASHSRGQQIENSFGPQTHSKKHNVFCSQLQNFGSKPDPISVKHSNYLSLINSWTCLA